MDDHVLFGVVNRTPHVISRVIGSKRTCGAPIDTLTTVDANDVGQRLIHERANLCLVTAPDGLQAAHFLQINAGSHAAPAHNALVHVTDDRVRGAVDFKDGLFHFPKSKEINTIFLGQRLQFTISIATTGVALAIVVRQHQVKNVTSGLTHLLGVSVNFHRL